MLLNKSLEEDLGSILGRLLSRLVSCLQTHPGTEHPLLAIAHAAGHT